MLYEHTELALRNVLMAVIVAVAVLMLASATTAVVRLATTAAAVVTVFMVTAAAAVVTVAAPVIRVACNPVTGTFLSHLISPHILRCTVTAGYVWRRGLNPRSVTDMACVKTKRPARCSQRKLLRGQQRASANLRALASRQEHYRRLTQ